MMPPFPISLAIVLVALLPRDVSVVGGDLPLRVVCRLARTPDIHLYLPVVSAPGSQQRHEYHQHKKQMTHLSHGKSLSLPRIRMPGANDRLFILHPTYSVFLRYTAATGLEGRRLHGNRSAIHALLRDAEKTVLLVKFDHHREESQFVRDTIAQARSRYLDLVRRRRPLMMTDDEHARIQSALDEIRATLRFHGETV